MAGIASLEELTAGAGRRRFTTTVLPVSGVTVRMRSLTEREMSNYEAAIASTRVGSQGRQARFAQANRQFIALCVVDEDGNLLVPQGESAKLAEMDAADTTHLYSECAKHSGQSAEDMATLVKNSETTPPDSSPTD